MTRYSISRGDAVGITIGVALLGAWSIGFWARAISKRRQDECHHNIRGIQIAYSTYVADGSSFVGRLQLEDLTTNNAVTAAAVFSTFYLSEHGNRNLLCPKDTRTSSQKAGTLRDENLSYFISISDIQHDPKAWLTGGRNLFPGPGAYHIRKQSSWTWNSSMGLHGTNGYIGLVDGSVTHSKTLESVNRGGANDGNVVVSP